MILSSLIGRIGAKMEVKKIDVRCSKTGLLFEFNTHEEKETFFDLWDKHEVIEPYEPTIKEIEEYIFKNMLSEVEEYQKYRKSRVENGMDLSESLFNWIAYVKKDLNIIKEVKENLKK